MKRVLVVLPNWFGETLFCTPFLRALHRQRPEVFLAVLGWPQTHEVLLNNPHVDLLLGLEARIRHKSPLGWLRLAAKLRALHFDTVFILRKSLSRTLLSVCAGIPQRIGFSNPKSGWLLTRRAAPAGDAVHKAASYMLLLKAAKLSVDDGCYEYAVTDAERAQASRLLAENGVRAGFALLHVGANWFHKQWPLERFAELGDWLAEKQGLQVAISGSPAEAADAGKVQQAMRRQAILLAGKTTLRELAACCEQAAVVVANDTGVMHICCALKRPVVALFGPTSPAITGPLGDAARICIIHHPESCPQIPCYSPDVPPHVGMSAISTEETYVAVCRLLGHSP